MKILVTGIAGFIGFHVAKKLLEQGYEVFGFDNINDYYDVNLKYARLKKIGLERNAINTCKQVKSNIYPKLSLKINYTQGLCIYVYSKKYILIIIKAQF